MLHAQHRVLIDNWIELRVSPRTAVLFKALRKQLFELMSSRIGADANTDDSSDDAWGGADGGAADGAPEGGAAAAPPTAARWLSAKALPTPGTAGWPPPMATREQAQEATLAALVWLIGKGLELQADELAAAALAAGKRPTPRR